MHLLCSFCIVYIFFFSPGSSLLSVCVLALLAWWQGVFSLHEGRCFEEGVEKLANDVFLLPFLTLSDSFSPFGCVFLLFLLSLSLNLTLFLCDLPFPIFPQHRCQLWRPRLTSLQTEEEEGEKGGYLSGWSLQKTALPTWTDCFSRSTAGTHTDRRTTMCTHHTYIF